jgi:pimeloyl-ACP methyl ester carboxylesterase/DNA-binding SARP family transcriptional activator
LIAAQRKPSGNLSLSLIGSLSVSLDDAVLDLPPSKKARALLAYLAATQRPQRRERLISLFWNDAESGREGLRWTLSRLRRALGPDGAVRIEADRDTVSLKGDAANCDFWLIKQIVTIAPAASSTADLLTAAGMAGGEFLEGLDLPDCYEFRLWCSAERENLRQAMAAILATLCDRLGHSEQALPYARRRVLLEPTEECAHVALVQMLVALRRLPEAEAHVETARQQFEAAGLPPPYKLIRLWAAQQDAAPKSVIDMTPRLTRQRVQFCTTRDGVRIAYAVSGEGPRIVKAANWYSHLEHDLENPIWQHLLNALAQDRQLVRYDRRGCGLSDRTTRKFRFDESLHDLEAVGGLFSQEPFDLVGFCSGGAMAAAYAARHPHHVRRLILIGSAAVGWRRRGPAARATNEHMIALTRQGWALENPAFRQVFTSLMFPDADQDQSRWFNELQRISAEPETAAALMDAFGDYDVTPLLPLVRCPTLVLHNRDDAMVPVEFGRECAAGIPDAQFITLPSRNHLTLENEPAWAKLKAEIEAFLRA